MSYIVNSVNSKVMTGVMIKEYGVGITGLTPTVEIRRISDSKYFDFAAVGEPYWLSTGGQRERTLPPAPWFDGLYQWEFDQSVYDQDKIDTYEILYRNDSPYKLVATELMSFEQAGLDVAAIREAVWKASMTPGGVQADMIMNLMWAMARGRMELGEENKINVYNDDDSYFFTIQLTPTEKTTSELEAGDLISYGSAGRYRVNPNPDPELCMVYGYLRYPTGDPVVNNDIEVYVDEKDLPQFADHSLLTGKIVVFHTDEEGYFQTDLVRNALVTMHIKQSNFKYQFSVPNQNEASIEDIPGSGVLKDTENPL